MQFRVTGTFLGWLPQDDSKRRREAMAIKQKYFEGESQVIQGVFKE